MKAHQQAEWRPATGDHRYRGSGKSGPGQALTWEPCNVCHGNYDDDRHGDRYQSCSYCGSMHPEDLFRLIPEPVAYDHEAFIAWLDANRGTDIRQAPPHNVSWADFKYGWPHKMYVDLGDGEQAKFYTVHLIDFPELIPRFNEGYAAPFVFDITADRLHWRQNGH